MDTTLPAPEVKTPEFCPVHQQPVKWHCAICGRPLCSACKPVAFNFQVYHPACLNPTRQQAEKNKAESPGEAPSWGVKIVAWIFLVAGIVLFGLGLLLLGIRLYSHHDLPLSGWLGQSFPVLDDIPGGRTALTWLSLSSFGISAVQILLGLGILNCVQTARRVVLFFAWLQVLVAGFAWAVIALAGTGFWDIPVFALFLIYFFSRRDVKQQFARVL